MDPHEDLSGRVERLEAAVYDLRHGSGPPRSARRSWGWSLGALGGATVEEAGDVGAKAGRAVGREHEVVAVGDRAGAAQRPLVTQSVVAECSASVAARLSASSATMA